MGSRMTDETQHKITVKRKQRGDGRSGGAPADYTAAFAAEIAPALPAAKPAHDLQAKDMPTCSTVFCWLRTSDFAEQYGYAMEQRAHAIFEEVSRSPTIHRAIQRNKERQRGTHCGAYQRTKLRMTRRKWFIARYAQGNMQWRGGMTISDFRVRPTNR